MSDFFDEYGFGSCSYRVTAVKGVCFFSLARVILENLSDGHLSVCSYFCCDDTDLCLFHCNGIQECEICVET